MLIFTIIYRSCEDYILCENCEDNSEEFHDKKHVFVKIHAQHPLCKELPRKVVLQKEFYK